MEHFAQPVMRGIVAAKANPTGQLSEDTEKMARRWFQNPEPKRSGKWWYLLLWQDEFLAGKRVRKRKRIPLAPATMSEREVKKIAAEFLRPLNQGLTPSEGQSVSSSMWKRCTNRLSCHSWRRAPSLVTLA